MHQVKAARSGEIVLLLLLSALCTSSLSLCWPTDTKDDQTATQRQYLDLLSRAQDSTVSEQNSERRRNEILSKET
jgi:hypothetical protein